MQGNFNILLQNGTRKGKILFAAAIAQLVERLIRNQQVGSPILLGGTIIRKA